jgi:hypothetical protein
MSSALGYPDFQRITQWFGAPLDQATAFALGAGLKTVGPLDVRSFASVVVCVKPTGGAVTVTVTQSVRGGPAGLTTSSSFVVAAGNVVFEAFVLLAGVVTVTFQGTLAGETLDYAIVPANTNTNAEVAALAQLGFQHNEVAVANETALDFVDATGAVFTVTDDPGSSRVKVAMPASPVRQVYRSAGVVVSNTVVETVISTLVIPAGALLGNGFARATLLGLFLNNTGVVQNVTQFKVYMNGVLQLATGSIASGGGVATLAEFLPYKLVLDVVSNGAANQFLYMTAQGSHGGSAALAGLFTAGLGAWSSVADSWFANGRTAAPAFDATLPITLAVSVVHPVANAQYQTSTDLGILEAATA